MFANKSSQGLKHHGLRFLLYFFGLSLIALSYWTQRYFGQVTISQLLSSINFDMQGALTADYMFMKRLIEWCLWWPFVVALLLLPLTAFCLNGRMQYWLGIGLIVYGFILLGKQYSVLLFINELRQPDKDYFAEHYVDPANVSFKLNHPKNLVLIYLEGMEQTYSDKLLFGRDLLSSFNQLNVSHLSYQSFEQMPGASWTIAGIIASQCGVPLRLMTIFNGNRLGNYLNHYLPGAVCLSDILAKLGYQNIFMKGASLQFSGMNTFLNDHAYVEAYGREEWLARGIAESSMNAWGLPDDLLFAQAKSRLDELMKTGKLFNLTLLTVDTHGYDGFINKTCSASKGHSFDQIVECSAGEAADLVNYIRAKGWLDKVNVVVLGDHLAMGNAVYEKIQPSKHRLIFNMILTKNKLTKNRDEVFHVDFLPTLLKLSGVQFKGDRLGLGYSALGRTHLPLESDRFTALCSQVNVNSPVYNALWLGKRD